MGVNVRRARARRDDVVSMSSYGRVEQNRCSRVFRGTFLLSSSASRGASPWRFTSPNARIASQPVFRRPHRARPRSGRVPFGVAIDRPSHILVASTHAIDKVVDCAHRALRDA
jgi:hypothetical protein